MSKSWKRALTLTMAIVALALIAASNVSAELKLFVTPPEGTSNSLYTFIAKWKDDAWPIPTPIAQRPVDNPGMVLLAGLPMYYVYTHDDYRCYVACVSAGLNMANSNQDPWNYVSLSSPFTSTDYLHPSKWFPDTSLNNLLWTPYTASTGTQWSRIPVWYFSFLRAGGNGVPMGRVVTARAWGDPTQPAIEATVTVPIHDSRPNQQMAPDGNYYNEMINYGGNNGDRDWLSAGAPDIDPLTVEPNNDGSGVSGDDGSSSHDFVFRVRYRNRDGIAPIPWWHSVNFSPIDYGEVSDWGVALYIDVWGIGDYRLIPMMPEAGGRTINGHKSLAWSDPGQVFIARLMPNDGMIEPLLYEYDKTYFPAWTCWAYNSLPVGTFNYFFACSDDWLRFTEHAELDYGLDFIDWDSATQYPRHAPFLLEFQPNLQEWGLEPTPNPQFDWTIPTTYTNYNGLRLLHEDIYYGYGVSDGVRDAVDWTRVPSDATDDLWGQIPWGRSDRGLTYSNAPDFTTVGFRANNNPLDPTNARQVTGNSDIDRSAHRKTSVDGRNAFDSTIFVDRPILVPGKFGSSYQYPADRHPVVGGQLTVPLYDDKLISFKDEAKYGGGRYYGTLLFGESRSFKRSLNPQMPGTFRPGSEVRTLAARRAETAGATTSTQCTYRIMYKSRDGAGPLYVRVLIGNTSSRGNKATEEYPDLDGDGYPGVTMSPDPSQSTPLNYKSGVWYVATRQLTTPGPYNYVFEASDGNQKIAWPRRPDHYEYNNMPWEDWWVPTVNTSDQYLIDDPANAGQKIRNPNYDSNDFVPGPFINSSPVLSNNSVDPTSAKQGQNFKFRVLYKDPDGQRPYSTDLIIETNSTGGQRRCQMLPEDVLDPNQDNSPRYKAGVYYYFNTATVQDLVMETGTRHYKFEFTDDWGRQVELNDRISGELAKFPVGGGWFSGPTISGNHAPTVSYGKVESGDGTNNSATLWTFRSTYGDVDNDAPTTRKVFIGVLQPDGKTILWDSGHDMLQSDANDKTFNDGVEFYYQTRLRGIENSNDLAAQYYYAFVFHDGYQWATYKSSSTATLRSNAANCFTADITEGGTLERLSSTQFKFNPVIVQQAKTYGSTTEVTPDDPNDIVTLMGVYLTEDLTGTSYYDPLTASPVFSTGAATVSLTRALPANTNRVWLKYQAQSPIVGPLPVGTPPPPGIIEDAQISVDGTTKLVDDMKSGWQDTLPYDRYSVMQGVATDAQSLPSVVYVTPEDSSLIASVEGVYATLDDVAANTGSYYDPAATPTETMTGIVDPSDVFDQANRTGKMILPASPDLIRSVIKVYSDAAMTLELPIVGGIDTKGKITLVSDLPLGTTVYIKYTRTLYNTGDRIIWLTDNVPTAGQTVFIKYSDVRFTHTSTGQAQDDSSGTWAAGTKYYSPDGWRVGNVHIKGNASDATGGVLGVWASDTENGRSYFDPWRVTHGDNELHLPLSYQVPSGTEDIWARYYQKGDYNIDRWNRIVKFFNSVAASSAVKSTYVFGSRMPMTVIANNAPTLSKGTLSPSTGAGSQPFVYTVTYTDTDGPNGQAPAYVRVYIDGKAQEMTAVSQGTPAYREGAVYTYTATNIGPKSHAYRFEASDGADIAIYDYYTRESITRPASGDPDSYAFIDLDGPWVNTPPVLLDGKATPVGTISANETVTFEVTYQDADNDPPYFYDQTRDLGNDRKPAAHIPEDSLYPPADTVSGSPRLWIDSDSNNVGKLRLGKVTGLLPDPLETTKMRTIVAKKSDGIADPGWTPDEFKDKLMQITDGQLQYRVYLIQSNTANTLTVATDNLGAGGDNLSTGSSFTINGLLMIRQDAVDFPTGSRYLLTVPKLAVKTDAHMYQFTARSRVTEPDWLYNDEFAKGKWVPYSDKAAFPTDGSSATGPKVTSAAPPGNTKPELKNMPDTAEASLYDGPKVKYGTVVSASKVKLDYSTQSSNWTPGLVEGIRKVSGVYRNANAVAGVDVNYYSTDTFDPTTGEITLSTPLGAVPAQLVQLGTVEALRLTVTPDVMGAIETVIGVYDNAELTGTNYYGSKGATIITLGTALPSGTTKVFIKYAPKALVEPPVYVQYFDKHVANQVFLAGDPLTFRVNYLDAENDPPTYHDSVQGSIRLVFDDTNPLKSAQMVFLNQSLTDYKTGVPFTVTLNDVPQGQQKYHFEASDGYDGHTVRYPTATPGYYTVTVNNRPTLTAASVDPSSGQPATTFKFAVTYKDLDGDDTGAPAATVKAILTPQSGDATEVSLEPPTGTLVYSNGVVFTGSTTNLAKGRYTVTFDGDDSHQHALPLTYGELVVRENNIAPELVSFSVDPAAGKLSQTFTYTATYKDADGDPPVVGSGAQKVEGLSLVVDKGLLSEQRFTMTRPSSTTPPDYTVELGVAYSASVLGSKLGKGKHTYTVEASDGSDSAGVPTPKDGPVLLVPLFDNIRVVSATATDPDAASGVSSAAVGDKVLIVGRMKFPKNNVTGEPSGISNVTIQLTKPDATTVALTGSVTLLAETANTDTLNWVGKLSVPTYPKGVDPALVTGDNLTLSASGEWNISAVWGGDAKWEKVQTDTNTDGVNDGYRLIVGGPMRTIAVKDPSRPEDTTSDTPIVDMITPPMVIGSSDPGGIFGYDRARLMQVVRWDPQSNAYYRFGLQGSFPELLPGDAVWIRPKSDYPTEAIKMADAESGLLALGNSGMGLDFTRKYRLIKVFSKAYGTQVNSKTGKTELAPCIIPLTAGWNQFGSIFFNWKKSLSGDIILPREDVGIPIGELRVRYLNVEKSISDAMAAGWIRDYAWRWDGVNYKYVAVHSTMSGADRVLKAWSGYWIRAFVNCDLIIDPNTSYNGVASTAAVTSVSSAGSSSELMTADQLDAPPPMPE
ncbi:MAG: collagen binding domain-containing protein [Armatimonadota bacterium]